MLALLLEPFYDEDQCGCQIAVWHRNAWLARLAETHVVALLFDEADVASLVAACNGSAPPKKPPRRGGPPKKKLKMGGGAARRGGGRGGALLREEAGEGGGGDGLALPAPLQGPRTLAQTLYSAQRPKLNCAAVRGLPLCPNNTSPAPPAAGGPAASA